MDVAAVGGHVGCVADLGAGEVLEVGDVHRVAVDAVEVHAVVLLGPNVDAGKDRRGLGELDRELGALPADVDIAHEAEGLAGRVVAVAVLVGVDHEAVQALAHVAAARGGEASRVAARAASGHRVGVAEVVDAADVRADAGAVPLELNVARVEVELLAVEVLERVGDVGVKLFVAARRVDHLGVDAAAERGGAEVDLDLAGGVVDGAHRNGGLVGDGGDELAVLVLHERVPARLRDAGVGDGDLHPAAHHRAAEGGVAEVDLHRTRRHRARTKAVDDTASRLESDVLGGLEDLRAGVGGGAVAGAALGDARGRRPNRVGRVQHLGVEPLVPGAEDDRAGDRVVAVVDDRRLDYRDRVLGQGHLVDADGVGHLRTRAGARLGVVRPAVLVEVLLRVVDVAVRPDVASVGLLASVLRLPDVGDLVVVGEELAKVKLTYLAEVVDARAVGLRVARVEGMELEDLADEVLGVVGEPVAVEVVVALVTLERVLPGVEVGHVVAVGVDVVGVGREVAAVVFKEIGKAVSVEVAVAVRVVPRREPDQLVGEVGDRADDAVPHAVGLEHHVELPAVGYAVAHAAVDRVGVVGGGA